MKRILFFLFVFFLSSQFATANNLVKYDITKGEYKRRAEEKVIIVGKVVNIAYELQHRPSGADSQDSLYSKGRQGVQVSGGALYTIVDNIKGQELQWNKAYLNKFVKIEGWVFHDANYIEVDSFSVDGNEFVWDNQTNTYVSKTTST